MSERPYKGEIDTSHKCPNCGQQYREHMLRLICQVSDCEGQWCAKRLDDALQNVPFQIRGSIVASVYMSLARPAASAGNVAWKMEEFTSIMAGFCKDVEDCVRERPDELEAFAEALKTGVYDTPQTQAITPH